MGTDYLEEGIIPFPAVHKIIERTTSAVLFYLQNYTFSHKLNGVIFMDPSKVTAMVSALAIIISNNIPDDDELALFIVALDQLEDDLNAIIAQRALIKKKIVL